MKRSKLSIAILCIALMFTGAILRNLIPLTPDWQHDIGMIAIFTGVIGLVRIIQSFRVKKES
jgi:hypothetical protein